MKKYIQELELKYPRQVCGVRESLKESERLEKNSLNITDEIVNCSGRMLSEIFVYKEDFWSNSLREFGYELGRFIYLMDAVLDYEYDKKKHNYNPLFVMEKQPEEMEPILMQAIGNATAIFEKLPILQDVGILKNVLYGGVWQSYYVKKKGKDKKHGNRSV